MNKFKAYELFWFRMTAKSFYNTCKFIFLLLSI